MDNNEGRKSKIKNFINKTMSMMSNMKPARIILMFAVIGVTMIVLSSITKALDPYKDRYINFFVSRITEEHMDLYTFIITEVIDLVVFIGSILILFNVFKSIFVDNYTGEVKDFFDSSNLPPKPTPTPEPQIQLNPEASKALSLIVNIFIKIVFFIPFIAFTLAFAGLIAAAIYMLTLVKYGPLFIGLAISLLGFASSMYVFVRIFWAIEVGTKVRPLLLVVCFILGMIITPTGLIFSAMEISSMESKEYDHSSDSTDVVLLDFNPSNYIVEIEGNQAGITFIIDDTMTDKFETKIVYDDRVFTTGTYVNEKGAIYVGVNSKLEDATSTLNFVFECIKHRSFMGAGSYSIELKTSEDNIKTIIKNTSDKYLVETTKEDNKYTLKIKSKYKNNMVCEDLEYYKKCAYVQNNCTQLDSSEFKYENDTLIYDTNKYNCVINNSNKDEAFYYCDLVN